jgi:quercetin dioxygenase-like cupin family protein
MVRHHTRISTALLLLPLGIVWAGCQQPAATDTAAAAAAPLTAVPTHAPDRAKHHFVKNATGKNYPRDLVITESKLTGLMTDGRLTFLDEVWKPGFAVVPHFHIEHAETFYVLSGQVEWTVNGETQQLGRGDLVYIPPDTVHAVKVLGTEDVRTLMIYEPGDYEEHLDEEQQYTPEQRKTPEIRQLLRSHFDFNPTTMPNHVARPMPPSAPAVSGQPPVVRPLQTTPQPSRHRFVLRSKGETFTPANEISEVKLTGADTDGRYSFLDEIWKPGMAVPPHYHAAHTEVFYVVAGQVEWTVGGETQLLGAGDLVYIPSDTVHSVKVVGTEDVQSLMLYTPGGYEYHSRREAQYTPEQRKQPDIQRRLRALNDFNPVP